MKALGNIMFLLNSQKVEIYNVQEHITDRIGTRQHIHLFVFFSLGYSVAENIIEVLQIFSSLNYFSPFIITLDFSFIFYHPLKMTSILIYIENY